MTISLLLPLISLAAVAIVVVRCGMTVLNFLAAGPTEAAPRSRRAPLEAVAHSESPAAALDRHRRCTVCNSQVLAGARTCRHCGVLLG